MMKQINIPATDFYQRSGFMFTAFKFALLMGAQRPSQPIRYRIAKLAAAIQAEKQWCAGVRRQII